MKFIEGVPVLTISVVTDNCWAIYEDGYIRFGDLPDFAHDNAERFSHWIDWLGGEAYPQTELQIVEIIARSLD